MNVRAWAEWMLLRVAGWVAPREASAPLVGDLLEEAAARAGQLRSSAWLWSQVVRSLPWLVALRWRTWQRAWWAQANQWRRPRGEKVAMAAKAPRTASAAHRPGAAQNGGQSRRGALVAATAIVAFGATAAAISRWRTIGGAPSTVPTPEKPAAFPMATLPRQAQIPLALVLVIDRSGSMSGTDTGAALSAAPGERPQAQPLTRMDLAAEAARRALRTVAPGDAVGVVAFDYSARWVASLARIARTSDLQPVEQAVAGVRPDGGTNIYLGLETAYRGLQAFPAQAKHVILFTDGEQGSSAPFSQLVEALRRDGITLSTVGLASTGLARATLERLARSGEGRSYFISTAAELPDVLEREAHTAVSLAHPLLTVGA